MLAKGLVVATLFLLGQMRPTALLAQATPTPQSTTTPPAARPATQRPTGASGAGAPSAGPLTPSSTGNAPVRQPATRASAPASTSAAPATPVSPSQPDCGGFPCDMPQPRVIAVNPPPAVAPWPWHDRILWAAYVVLAIVGYAGVMLGWLALRRIENQATAVEAAVETAQNSANAALLSANALASAERPWLLVTVEPSLSVENGFTVMTTNRGRSPAQIVATAERLRIAPEESKLPREPEYGDRAPEAPMVPIILLPGESAPLKPFSRADARDLCESDEQFARIENWEEKVFLYGRVIYKDLISSPDKQTHQTDWCCWYIHGRQKSGLVIAGGPEYNQHT